MWVAELWRYPVKSMAGERLGRAEIRRDGIVGDRVVQVRRADGRAVTARTRPALLGHRALLGSDGEPLVDGRRWTGADVARDVARAAGAGARLVRYDGVERFDVLPLLLGTDGAIAVFGHDRRRLRPNIVVGGVPHLAEREWDGRVLRIGSAVVGVRDLRQRCIMTTFDPDTLEQDVEVLRDIRARFGGKLALNCYVVEEGTAAVGDAVLLMGSADPVPPLRVGDDPERLPSVNAPPRCAKRRDLDRSASVITTHTKEPMMRTFEVQGIALPVPAWPEAFRIDSRSPRTKITRWLQGI